MFREWVFPQKIDFRRSGGQGFNTAVVAVQSGQEQRNRNWLNARRKYTATLFATTDANLTNFLAALSAVQTFHLLVGGMGDSFRFFDELDFQSAANEPLVVIPATSNLQWQLSRTYSFGGVNYVRSITKPIGPPAIDYLGNALADSVTLTSLGGGSSPSIDHTTGIVTFGVAPTGTPTATFQYHIPVRFTSDEFDPEIEKSAPGSRFIKWNSLGLIEVLPPNY